jgi:dynein heavy chain
LETKRQAFPRFYFLSNDELLQILANAADIKAVEKHINKCFDNICGLILSDPSSNASDISGMISGEREEVNFVTKVKVKSNGVETWMRLVEQ